MALTFAGYVRKEDKNAKEAAAQPVKDGNLIKSDKAELYAMVFDEVWKLEEGFNSQIKYVIVNTNSFKGFTEEDKKQLFDYISKKYNVTMLDMSHEDLKIAGHVKETCFEEGMMFQIDKYNDYSSCSISLEGEKLRSPIGFIGFSFEAEKKNNKWELKKCCINGGGFWE